MHIVRVAQDHRGSLLRALVVLPLAILLLFFEDLYENIGSSALRKVDSLRWEGKLNFLCHSWPQLPDSALQMVLRPCADPASSVDRHARSTPAPPGGNHQKGIPRTGSF